MYNKYDSIYIIVYPSDDKNRLSIVSIERCVSYEINHYSLASRHIHYSAMDVVNYAKHLSSKYNLPLESKDQEIINLLNEDACEEYLD